MAAKDFLPRITNTVSQPSRRLSSNFLPAYLQTSALTKFLSVTADTLIQPSSLESISGFVGEKNGLYYDPSEDFYIQEPTAKRNDYQLEPTVVSVDNTNTNNFTEFYSDIVNSLKFDGANTINESRLFSQEYYSWCPPINPDMFINFTNYFWVQIGPQINIITDITDVVTDIIGQISYTTPSGLVLSSGMKVQFTADVNTEYNNTAFIVEGVGNSISLINDNIYNISNQYDVPSYDSTPYDGYSEGTPAQYWTIRRDSNNGNAWSRSNRWFHKNVLGNVNSDNSSFIQATRPIIEFLPNLELYNWGRYARQDVDVLSTKDNLVDIVGKSSYSIDGVPLVEGMTILLTGDTNTSRNNIIYRVFGINTLGVIGLSIVKDGLNANGIPQQGETVRIKSGIINAGQYYWYNNNAWILGQTKNLTNQPPLFSLYDIDNIRLDDSIKYPQSNFTGSVLFNYVPNGNIVDTTLGINLTFDTFGDISFYNDLGNNAYTYVSNEITNIIKGYYWCLNQNNAFDSTLDQYLNDWYGDASPSRQTVNQEFVITPILDNLNLVEYQRSYNLAITPDQNINAFQPNVRVYLNGNILVENTDYDVSENVLMLSDSLALNTNDVLEIQLYADTIPTVTNDGYFSIPFNLESNPNNQRIVTQTFNEILPQLSSIINAQTSLVGSAFGNNNFRDTLRNLSLGSNILNHTASMLRVGLLTGSDNLKLTNAIRYSNREYTTFFSKLLIKLNQFITQGYTDSIPASTWLSDAITQINLGKNSSFPFYNSNSTSQTYYIPATAAVLGVTKTYTPEIFLDTLKTPATMVIRRHDGSLFTAYNDYRDQVILELENQIYNNIDSSYSNPDRVLEFDSLEVIPGYWRTTDYSREEWLNIQKPRYDRWAVANRLDTVLNTTFDQGNPLTWNYSNTKLPNGKPSPGHWRGIFQYFYDTFRPHTSPWEMLGFSQEPLWWQSEYGSAPYTAQNLYMWTDLSTGTIKQGNRAGTYDYLSREGLLNFIPVDSQGNLIDPISLGLVNSVPNVIDAQANWNFGDLSPVETRWFTSSSYSFDLSEALYLAKPARFVDTFWEARKLARDHGQIYNTDFLRRTGSIDLLVHNQLDSLGNLVTVKGISQWSSDYLTSKNIDITANFAYLQTYLNAQLGYRTASFIDTTTLELNSESFGIIPSANINTILYEGASISQPIYSAVIVIWDGTSYRISGYDSVSQKFKILPVQNSSFTSLTVKNVTVNNNYQIANESVDVLYYSSFSTRQSVYDFFVGYQAWLESQGWSFADYDTVNSRPKDFISAANDFLSWSQIQLTAGDAIIFSPASDHLVYNFTQGFVDNTAEFVNGVYGVLDRLGFAISNDKYTVTRNANSFEITLNDSSVQGVYCLRLSLKEYEHALILDNTTNFGNLIYNPVLGIRLPRLQIFVDRTTNWLGQPIADGFLVQDSTLIKNFETSVDQFRHFYDFDRSPSSGDTNALAQHTLGYVETDYMDGLLLDNKTEFDYYLGFIKSKGTLPSFSNILRSNFITKTAGFNVLEEWAFLLNSYGNTERKSSFELQIRPSDFTTNPQLIEFNNIADTDPTHIDILPNDPRWVLKNTNNTTNKQFTLRNFQNDTSRDLPTAGYVQLNETTYTVLNTSALTDLFSTQVLENGGVFNDGDTIWQILKDDKDWTVYRVCKDAQLVSIEIGENPSDPTIFTCLTPHDLNPNDILFLQTSTATSGELQGVQQVLNTNSSSQTLLNTQFSIDVAIDTGIIYSTEIQGTIENPVFTIGDTLTITLTNQTPIIVTLTSNGITQTVSDINNALINAGNSSTTASISQSNQLVISDSLGTNFTVSGNVTVDAGLALTSNLVSPFVYVLKPVRFSSLTERDNFVPFNGWLVNDLSFVDSNELSLWAVYSYSSDGWGEERLQNDRINTDVIYTTYIYDSITNIDQVKVQVYDPVKGLIFASADEEITYKIDNDPAFYTDSINTNDNIDIANSWGAAQLGQLWWDLSTTRYLDYEQGDLNYRRKNWGSLAPGVSVDIYEWTASPVSPDNYASYVLSQQQTGTNRPSGTVYVDNQGDTPFSQVVEYDSNSNSNITTYYFWVLLPTTIPDGLPQRRLDANSVANLISNTVNQNIVWFAPIDINAFIIYNADTFINDQSSVLQVVFYENANDSIIHKQWLLLREEDQNTPPYIDLWNKLRDSLVGFDDLNLTVPDPTLSSVIKYGTAFRPRQTFFSNRLIARRNFIEKVNNQLALVNAVAITNWDSLLRINDPLPDSTMYDIEVSTRAARNLLIGSIGAGTRVLVLNDELLNNYWSLWTYQGNSQWTLISNEQYRSTDYWQNIDWYSAGYSVSTKIDYTFNTISDMNSNVNEFVSGNIIKVLNNGAGNFAIYLYTLVNGLSQFALIAQGNGTIEFLDNLYNYDITNTSLDLAISTVLKNFILAFRNTLLTTVQQNEIFITMVRYAHTEQSIIPWAFKTSMVYGQGFDLSFTQDYILPNDETDDLVSFFTEAKPYHVKLRTLTEQRRTQVDTANVQVTDQYTNHIKFLYDRVIGTSNIPDNANPANYDVNKLTAADRAQLYYAPTEGMPPKVLSQLVSRTEFGGTVMDGAKFYQFGTVLGAGFDNQPYDENVLGGYDFDTRDLEKFYDVFVNGGASNVTIPGNFLPVNNTDSSIIIDGNKFIEPLLSKNHPEELTRVRAGDAVSISIYTQDTPTGISGYDTVGYDTGQYDSDLTDLPVSQIRRPKMRTKIFSGTPAGITGSFTIGQVPQNKQALFVYLNGVLLKPSQFTYNTNNSTIILNNAIFTNDILTITSFGVGGGVIQKRKVYNNSNATTFDLKTPISDVSNIFATVDGAIATVSYSGTQITIMSPIPNNSQVAITIFDRNTFSKILTEQTVLTSTNQLVPVASPAKNANPQLLNTDVFLNGLRLMPFPSNVFTRDGITTSYNLPVSALLTTNVILYNNGQLVDPTTYTTTNTQIIFNDAGTIGETYLVIVQEGADYSIIGNESIQLNVGNAGDTLAVTTYAIDDTFGTYQLAYFSNPNNNYIFGLKPRDINSILVYKNGNLLNYGVNYKLIDSTTGYDSLKDNASESGFANASNNIAVQITDMYNVGDKIVIKYFTQLPSKEPIAFRIFKNIFGNYEFSRISDANSTFLTNTLLPSDRTITVNDATVLKQPDINNQEPGIIFINGERIIFWTVDTSVPNQNVLGQCLRGTQGTGINLQLSSGTIVRDANTNQILPDNRLNWEVNTEGLIYADSEVADFLRMGSGSVNFSG